MVLSKPVDDAVAVIADIRKFAATKLAKFKVHMMTILRTLHALLSKNRVFSQHTSDFPCILDLLRDPSVLVLLQTAVSLLPYMMSFVHP